MEQTLERDKKKQRLISTRDIFQESKEFVKDPKHPCIMAKSVVNNDSITCVDYGELGTEEAAHRILNDLKGFGKKNINSPKDFQSHLAEFSDSNISSEEHFEELLWQQLRLINKLDDSAWDSSVSSDPSSPDFSFSVAGTAYYLVGMHPKSSRLSRRYKYPAIAFNMHKQFEYLRKSGRFEKVRDTIRKRDNKLQGNTNPMVLDFGVKSEARQYSGRKTDDNWKCPFH